MSRSPDDLATMGPDHDDRATPAAAVDGRAVPRYREPAPTISDRAPAPALQD